MTGRTLRGEGSGRFRIVGCYGSATTEAAKAAAARAAAFRITVDATGFVIVLQDGPDGTSVEVVRGTAVQVVGYLRQHPEVLGQGGTITFTASGAVLAVPAGPGPPSPDPTPPPSSTDPPPSPATGSCAGGVTDSGTDAVQDSSGPINPLPDLLCASGVRDGANIVVTTQATQPIPDFNRPETFFYLAGALPANTPPYGYALFPCAAWLDMRQKPPGFLGSGVYDCTFTQTVIAPASFTTQAGNTYVSTFAAAPAGLSGAFYWRVVLEGTCGIIDTIPDRTEPVASAAC